MDGPTRRSLTWQTLRSAAPTTSHPTLALALLQLVPAWRRHHGTPNRVVLGSGSGDGHRGCDRSTAIGLLDLELHLVTRFQGGAADLITGDVELSTIIGDDEAVVLVGVEDLDVSVGHGTCEPQVGVEFRANSERPPAWPAAPSACKRSASTAAWRTSVAIGSYERASVRAAGVNLG